MPKNKTEEPETDGAESGEAFFRRFLLLLNVLLLTGGCLGLACGVFASGMLARAGLTALGIVLLILFGRTFCYTVKLKKSGAVSREPVSDSLWKKIGRKLFWIDGQETEPESPDKPDVRNETIRIPDGESPGEQQERSGQRRERQVRMEVLQKELEALYQERESLYAYDRELEAVDLAMLRIRELSQRIYREAGTNFSDRASALLEQLTEGRYTHIALDEKQQVKINTPARLLEMRQVSYGTMNQIYFALRMAAGDVLSGGRPLPVILDEPFAMYDEERLEAALRWLENSGRQVILFSCQKREKEMLERIRAGNRNYR